MEWIRSAQEAGERELLNCGFIDNLRAPEVHVKGATAQIFKLVFVFII